MTIHSKKNEQGRMEFTLGLNTEEMFDIVLCALYTIEASSQVPLHITAMALFDSEVNSVETVAVNCKSPPLRIASILALELRKEAPNRAEMVEILERAIKASQG